jgi:hypothetical protein
LEGVFDEIAVFGYPLDSDSVAELLKVERPEQLSISTSSRGSKQSTAAAGRMMWLLAPQLEPSEHNEKSTRHSMCGLGF